MELGPALEEVEVGVNLTLGSFEGGEERKWGRAGGREA